MPPLSGLTPVPQITLSDLPGAGTLRRTCFSRHQKKKSPLWNLVTTGEPAGVWD